MQIGNRILHLEFPNSTRIKAAAWLDELSEVLLDFAEVADLVTWLNWVRIDELAQGDGENGGADEVIED